VYLDEKNIFQPIILFIENERKHLIKERGIFGAPDLVIEILSYNRNYDLVDKKNVYEKRGVKEYWVVDPVTKWCEGFTLNNGSFISLGENKGKLYLKIFDLQITY
jgi:Uma2 family endonuclease